MSAEPTEIKLRMTSPILGRRVSFVGKLGGINRKEARSLVREQGAVMVDKIDDSVDLIVTGADLAHSTNIDDLVDAWVVQAIDDDKIEVMDETRLWEILGLVEAETNRLYTPSMLAELLSVPLPTIRRWHRRGLIKPMRQVNRLPYFDFQEVATARRIAKWISEGASQSTIEAKLAKIALLFPNLQNPLSQLSVIVRGRDVLLRNGGGLVEPNGQRRFDFDEAVEPDGVAEVDVVSIAQNSEPAPSFEDLNDLSQPSEFLQLANELEDSESLESAAEVYRAMGLAFGANADVSFRLAEVLYQLGQLEAARERYYQAIELDSQLVEARASLGCLLVEMDQPEFAISAFQGALEHYPNYPDVHFHLARLHDQLEAPTSAAEHWRTFIELAPNSPWADEARQRLAEIDG